MLLRRNYEVVKDVPKEDIEVKAEKQPEVPAKPARKTSAK